jgi:hypothetical protein
MAQILAPWPQLYMEQHWVRDGPGCCVPITNQYRVHGGDNSSGPIIIQATEKSDCCCRTFCEPHHAFKMEIKVTGGEYTIERPGLGGGKPCVCCCACSDACLQEMTMHAGNVQGEVGALQNPNPLFIVKQAPASQSMFEPVLNVTTPGDDFPVLTVRGPTFFGGCSELCCESHFGVTNRMGQSVGSMKKKVPSNCCQCCEAICTDLDRYDIKFEPTTTPQEKVALMTSTLMADYMLFEQDPGLCRYRNGVLKIHCCNFYCAGCLVPCTLIIPLKQN